MSNEYLPDIDWAGLESDLAQAAMKRRQTAVDTILKIAGVAVDDEGDEEAHWADMANDTCYSMLHFHDPRDLSEHYFIEAQSIMWPSKRSTIMFAKGSPDVAAVGGILADDPLSQTELRDVLEKVLTDAMQIVRPS